MQKAISNEAANNNKKLVNFTNTNIVIDDELKNLLSPLVDDEYQNLEQSIIKYGCREPLILWDNILVDGHNRYAICKKHGIPFKTQQMDFANKNEAKLWIIDNQLGRRNISLYQKGLLALKRTEIRKIAAKENQRLGGRLRKEEQNDIDTKDNISQEEKGFSNWRNPAHPSKTIDTQRPINKINTEKEAAKIANIGYGTIARIKFIDKHATPKQKEQLITKQKSINKVYNEIKKLKKKQEIAKQIAAQSHNYTNDKDIKIIEGDMLVKIQTIPDKSIDLLLTDPPYLVTDNDWDQQNIDFVDKWVNAIKPKLKDKYIGFIFCDVRRSYEFETILRKTFIIKNKLAWIRKNLSMGRVVKDRFISSYELCFYFGNKPLAFPEKWGEERFDSMEFAVPQTNFKDTKYHPTQKPFKLIERLVKLGSSEQDTVLDPFAGSGTTGIACKLLNRKCFLIEQNHSYVEVIKGRLNQISNPKQTFKSPTRPKGRSLR